MNITDSQIITISINCRNFHTLPAPGGLPSSVTVPLNLNFSPNEFVLRSIVYGVPGVEIDNVVQIWCSLANEGLIGAFPNGTQTSVLPNQHFRLNNTVQRNI